MDVDLNSLMVFRDLASSGNFSETGRRLGLNQPAVSLTISQLESAVGLVLLERGAGGARLTPAGVVFLARVQEVCEVYLSFKDGVRMQGRRFDREVWVGLDGSWYSRQLAQALESEPIGKDMKFLCGKVGENWGEDLEEGRVDVVIASRFLQEGMTAGIQEGVIRQERGITVAWHPSFHPFDKAQFNFPEVLRTTLLIPNGHVAKGFGKFLRHWCEYAYGMQAANTVFFDSEEAAARAADAGLGVFLGPGNSMNRLREFPHELKHVRTFEFLLPEAYRFGVYCRGDERAKEVLQLAVMIGKAGRKQFSNRDMENPDEEKFGDGDYPR
ncbi:MAG: LysR family transcriptional regulator [Armatimonadetes bacterium]|nr:LysR family transcriptional regulator [Akkermansiaceae bacterium]